MENRNLNIRGFIGFGLMILIFFMFEWFRKQNIQKDAHFTLATIQKFSFGADGTKLANFDYIVGGKTFKGSFAISDTRIVGTAAIGSKYVIVYSKSNPNNAYLNFDYRVSDSIKNIPINGWPKLPWYIKKW
jgi:hypothetical protein